jgi:hypothetical protein
MGSKTRAPNPEDYKPTETEQIAAAIAKEDADYFERTYDPLLVEMRDKAATEDVGSTVRGRAQADTMQALTSNLDLGVAKNIGASAEAATAAVGQMLAANVASKDAKITQQTGVLGTARGQRADTGDALSQAARFATSVDLNRVQNEQSIRRARRKALMDTATAAGAQMGSNLARTSELNRINPGSVNPSMFTKVSRNPTEVGGQMGYQSYGLGGSRFIPLVSNKLTDQQYNAMQGFEPGVS